MNIQNPLDVDFRDFLKKQLERVKFRSAGLFIGKEFVDLVELRRTFSGPRLVNYVSIPLPTHIEKRDTPEELAPLMPPGEGEISTHEQFLMAIRRALREGGIRNRKVVSILSEEEVIVRYFQMPRLPRREWEQAVRFEARKYIPFTLEELMSDFCVLQDKKDKGRMNVVFVAAKKEVVARHLALLSKANLQPSHLEALPFSFLRLLSILDPEAKKEKAIGVVDVDGNSCSIILMKEGLPYLVRRVSLELPPPSSLPSEEGTGESPSTHSPFVDKLLDEVRLTLRYYRNQFPTENVSRLFLFGDGLKAGVPEIFTRELNLPTRMAELSKLLGITDPVPLRLARTIGLGLRGLTESGAEIELLPKRETVPSQKTKLFKISLLEGAGAVAVLIFLSLILSNRVSVQKRLLEVKKQEMGKKAAITFSKADLEKKKEMLTQKLNLYTTLYGKRIVWTKKLSQLGRILPQGAWVTHMDVEDSSGETGPSDPIAYRLTLRGSVYAPDKAEELRIPSQFLAAIQQDADFIEGFNDAKLTSVKRDLVEEVGITSFEIVLTGKK